MNRDDQVILPSKAEAKRATGTNPRRYFFTFNIFVPFAKLFSYCSEIVSEGSQHEETATNEDEVLQPKDVSTNNPAVPDQASIPITIKENPLTW